jgi:hypothetical protein
MNRPLPLLRAGLLGPAFYYAMGRIAERGLLLSRGPRPRGFELRLETVEFENGEVYQKQPRLAYEAQTDE